MLMFALRARDPDSKPDLLTDVDVAHRLGVDRATIWKWLDERLIPEPKKIGLILMCDGRKRSRMTRWLRKDIDLFIESKDMLDFLRRKRQAAS